MRVMVVTGFYPGARMGGAEYQTALLAQGLAARGHEVAFLATSTGQSKTYAQDGVQIWEVSGWNKVGHAQHREQIAEIFAQFKPEICYIRLLTELDDIAALCRLRAIPYVSVSCSLKETSPLLFGYHPRETIGYLRSQQTLAHWRSFQAIRGAALHVSNTHELRERVQRWFPKQSMRTIYNGSPMATPAEIHGTRSGQIIWVNNLKRGKRPELFVELARRLPAYQFVMIGAIPDYGFYARTLQRMVATGPANFRYLGAMSVEGVNEQISKSDLLVYTSKAGVEGFGNSFLQAWFRGVPTASLSFRLDGILERERVGLFAERFDDFVVAIEQLMADEPQRAAMGERALHYALQNYRVETMVEQYEAAFQELLYPRGRTQVAGQPVVTLS